MSDTTATLSIDIDTGLADSKLDLLEKRMATLGEGQGSVAQVAPEIKSIGDAASAAAAKIAPLSKELKALGETKAGGTNSPLVDMIKKLQEDGRALRAEIKSQAGQIESLHAQLAAKMAQAQTGGISLEENRMRIMLRSAEMTGNAIIKQYDAMAKAAPRLELKGVKMGDLGLDSLGEAKVQLVGRIKDTFKAVGLAAKEAAKQADRDAKDALREVKLGDIGLDPTGQAKIQLVGRIKDTFKAVGLAAKEAAKELERDAKEALRSVKMGDLGLDPMGEAKIQLVGRIKDTFKAVGLAAKEAAKEAERETKEALRSVKMGDLGLDSMGEAKIQLVGRIKDTFKAAALAAKQGKAELDAELAASGRRAQTLDTQGFKSFFDATKLDAQAAAYDATGKNIYAAREAVKQFGEAATRAFLGSREYLVDNINQLDTFKRKAREAAVSIEAFETRSRLSSRLSPEIIDRQLGITNKPSPVAQDYLMYGATPASRGSSMLAKMEAEAAQQLAESLNTQLTPAQMSAGQAARLHHEHMKKMPSMMWEAHSAARGLAGGLNALWLTYGSTAPLLAGAALSASFVQAAKMGAELEHQLTFVKALGNESASSIQAVRETVGALGGNSSQGPVELAQGFRILSQAGLNASESIIAINSAIDLAVVGEMQMEQASNTLVGVMNAFGLTVSSLSHVGDVFAKAAALSQTSVAAMTEAMKTASVVGEQYGATMEDTAAAVTLLAKVNITGTAAGTALRNMLKEIYTPVPKSAAVFKQLEIETKDAEGNLKRFSDVIFDLRGKLEKFDKASQTKILQDLFGERGAKEAIAMLAAGQKEWDKLVNKISQSSGFIRQVSAELESGTKGIAQQALNTLKNSLVGAFESTEGPMKALAVRMKQLFNSNEFQAGVKSSVDLMASFAGAVVSAAETVTRLISILPDGTGTFIKMAAAAGTSALALSGMVGLITRVADAMLAMRMASLAGAASLAPLYIGIGAVAAAYVLFNGKTPEYINSINAVNTALDTQIERMRVLNKELQRKLDLNGNGAAQDVDVARNELNKAVAERDRLKKLISDDDNSKRTIAGKEIGDRFSTDEATRKRRAEISEARANIAALDKAVNAAQLKLAIAEGYQIELQKNQSKAMAQDLIRQQEERDRLKAGTKTWTSPNDKKGDGKEDRSLFNVQKASILEAFKFAEQQAKAHYDSEKRLLNEAYKGRLLGEQEFADLREANEREYDNTVAEARKRAFSDLESLKDRASAKSQRESIALEVSRIEHQRLEQGLLDSINQREQQRLSLIKAQVESRTFRQETLPKAEAKLETKFKRVAENAKIELMPARQAVGASAAMEVRDEFENLTAARREELKIVTAQLEGQLKLDERMGISSQSAADLARRQALLSEDISLATAAMERQADAASNLATGAYDAQNSFSHGWSKAFRDYIDNSSNAARMAQDAFGAMASGMENALVSFVTTGKFSFSQFANSIIADLARIAARKAVVGFLGSMGLGSLFGGAAAASTPVDSMGMWAKGGAFDQSGVHAFAKGGAFTNSVVTNPTFFKFANGSKFGVMGEAGPEAVMPLTRDSAGRLGVRAQGGSGGGGGSEVSIVINNTMSDQANVSAQPRMNNGKMEIEVIVQQVMNKDMRTNGPITQGLASTFGMSRAVR